MRLRRDLISRICLVVAILSGLGLFALHRLRRPEIGTTISKREVADEMRSRARQAVSTAAHDYRISLNFSPESVEKVEEILGKIHDRHIRSPLADSELAKESLKWGAYIGEVIKTVRPCQWAVDSEGNGAGSLPVVYQDKSEVFPILWCHERITIGDDENVWHKFLILVVDRDKSEAIEFKPEGVEGNVK